MIALLASYGWLGSAPAAGLTVLFRLSFQKMDLN